MKDVVLRPGFVQQGNVHLQALTGLNRGKQWTDHGLGNKGPYLCWVALLAPWGKDLECDFLVTPWITSECHPPYM